VQATFHVLARKADSIKIRGSLGSWLYTVARRIALRARAKSARERDREKRFADMPRREALDETTWLEISKVLDEEMGQLPEKYRAPLVLCYFEGKGRDLVARELGWAEGTVARRLARGRELLRHQLVRRGIMLSARAPWPPRWQRKPPPLPCRHFWLSIPSERPSPLTQPAGAFQRRPLFLPRKP
jgi:RNA polymerase sigma factor (sigma-70 family)